jgi:hypothetical protein
MGRPTLVRLGLLLVVAAALSACGGTPVLPTPASLPTSVNTSAATIASQAGSSAGQSDGTLLTALTRLHDATSFHYVYTTNGKARIEGDALGLKGNFHYTTVPDPTNPTLGIIGGEWLVIRNGNKADSYQKQNGKWVKLESGMPDLSYTYVALLVGADYSAAKTAPNKWQDLGAQNVSGQDAEHYTVTIIPGEPEEAWVSKSSGDIVQLQEKHLNKDNSVSALVVMVFSNIDQPVTLPLPT